MSTTKPITENEAIDRLERLAARWPENLWLFSSGGVLHVMRTDDEGRRVYTSGGGVDPEYIVTYVEIPNDGGDW